MSDSLQIEPEGSGERRPIIWLKPLSELLERPLPGDSVLAAPQNAVPYSKDSKHKYQCLKNQLRKPTNIPVKFEFKVRREAILVDSFRIIMNGGLHPDVLKARLHVEFDGEDGRDFGGLTKEWFFLLSKEMFNPYYGLFEFSTDSSYSLQINPNSGLNHPKIFQHLKFFKFVGRIAGMAIHHGKLLDVFLIRPFYKLMLGKRIELKDVENVDPEYYNSLLWIKENDPSELGLTFSVNENIGGLNIQRYLKPNGANIPLTRENKYEYIRLLIQWRYVTRVQEQMNAFLKGFNEIVPLKLIQIFDEYELELLMCGSHIIDVKDWQANTVYKLNYNSNNITIQTFWRVVSSFSNEMRSKLLQFVTGMSRVPMNGFRELTGTFGRQMFTIQRWGTIKNFPRSETNYNRLFLPPYESYDDLKHKLTEAISRFR